jgi:hypothetical protein
MTRQEYEYWRRELNEQERRQAEWDEDDRIRHERLDDLLFFEAQEAEEMRIRRQLEAEQLDRQLNYYGPEEIRPLRHLEVVGPRDHHNRWRLLPLLSSEFPGTPDDPTYVAAVMNGTLTQDEHTYVNMLYRFAWDDQRIPTIEHRMQEMLQYARHHPNVAGVIRNLANYVRLYVIPRAYPPSEDEL